MFSQSGFAVRLETGLRGAREVVAGADVAVVVDVLSFTTTLSVAADRGVAVVPCPWRDHRASELAARHRATLAVGRSAAGPGEVSLAPGSVRRAHGLRRLVLPSPNGSTISAGLAGLVPVVLGASLRNRAAVAAWLDDRGADRGPLTVAFVAAGERWPDGTLRPAVEDVWGAGAVIAALGDPGAVSPEAASAAAAFRALGGDLPAMLHGCAGGRELTSLGHPEDVDIAAELDAGVGVPVLVDGVFGSSPPRPSRSADTGGGGEVRTRRARGG